VSHVAGRGCLDRFGHFGFVRILKNGATVPEQKENHE